MMNLLVLYRGDSVADMKLVAATASPTLVAGVADGLLAETHNEFDPVLRALSTGHARVLQLIRDDANKKPGGPSS